MTILRALIKSMRLRQWPKNLFILAAVIFDGQLFNRASLLVSIAGVLVFCLISSSVYLINDVKDLNPTASTRSKRTARSHPASCQFR